MATASQSTAPRSGWPTASSCTTRCRRRRLNSIAEIARAGNLAKVGELGMSFGGAISGELCMYRHALRSRRQHGWRQLPVLVLQRRRARALPDVPLRPGQPLQVVWTAPCPPPARAASTSSRTSASPPPARRPDIYRISLKDTQHLGMSDFSLFVGDTVKGAVFGTAPSAHDNQRPERLHPRLPRQTPERRSQRLSREGTGQVTRRRRRHVPKSDVAPWWNAKPEAERAALEARINAAKPVYPRMPMIGAAPVRR